MKDFCTKNQGTLKLNTNCLRTLLVDGSDIICSRLTKIANNIKSIHLVGQANRLSEAEVLIEETNPNIVIMDIRLPDGNGIELLRKIKNTSEKEAATVIVLTNYSDDNIREVCKKYSCEYVLDKMTEFDKVEEILKKLSFEI